jgi:hypothetical protein
MKRVLAFVVFGLVPGCIALEAFPCQLDEECDLDGREGSCEVDHACSYPDSDCLSGRRYEDRAGGECVALRVDCEDYCRRYAEVCSGETSQYLDHDNCRAQCAQWPTGTLEDVEGDSLGCRINQFDSVDEFHPAVSCVRAGPSGLDTCVAPYRPLCEQYCLLWMGLCEPLRGPFPGGACLDVCGTWYPGEISPMEEHSVGCRLVRLMNINEGTSMEHHIQLCFAGSPDSPVCVLPQVD